ncbi:MAG: ribosome maturation factor RimM [Pseudomonadota bacterium]|nr:ribosome maturation factor RimM [Pseudomonadota bacterium]
MVVMGHITGPFGVSGWIKVFPYTEHVDGLLDYPVWWLGKGDGDWREIKVTGCEAHGSILTAVLEQYADRTAAMRLKGMQIAIPRSRLPDLSKNGKDGYYWSDLIGLEVINLQNEELGKVTGLLETGANDVLQVQSLQENEKERLIPFISQVIIKVDLEACRITVDWGMDY